jgi:3-oxoacyl-[acyl-carrier protein] reductase
MRMTQASDGWALVTGAGSPEGIGFAIAAALGATGRRVAITSTTERIDARVRELRARGVTAVGAVADLMQADAAERLVAAVGRIDILVNNAGMAVLGVPDEPSTLEAMTPDTWRRVLERNLTTAFTMTRAVLPAMKAQRFGRIVHVSSTTGPLAGIAGETAYAASKAGLVGMMRALCLEVAPFGVTVNAIAPGWIATGSQTPAEARAGHSTPAGRSGTPAEVAAAAVFLCGAGASYVNGHLLVVDGGNYALESRG